MRIELVKWRDACDVRGDLSKVRLLRLPLMVTVGAVVEETEERIILKFHWQEVSSDCFPTEPDDEAIAIPTAWIEHRTCLFRDY